MRVIIYGVGAVGGTVAAALVKSGCEVLGIARGGMLTALRDRPLTLRGVETTVEARIPVVETPAEIAFRPDDIVLLTVKSQDTLTAMEALRAAGLRDQPIFCAQNGIGNERTALRYFPNVHGVTVMMPVTYVTAGEVLCFVAPRFGLFELGRYPTGTDADDARLAEALEAANIGAFPDPDVMAGKCGKLLMNLRNILEAALGRGNAPDALTQAVRAEATVVYRAAGLSWRDVGQSDPRRQALIKGGDIPGQTRRGGSTIQSMLRGTGRLETDWLNGEIALLGRLHGVPVPLNAALTRLGAKLASEGAAPGGLTLDDLAAWLAEHADLTAAGDFRFDTIGLPARTG